MDFNVIVEHLPTIAAVLSPVAAAGAWAVRRISQLSRTVSALSKAVEHGDAHNRGVVLVLTYPGAKKSAVPLLELNDWKICQYDVQSSEGVLPSGERVLADLATADVVVLQGMTEALNAELAQLRNFRDALRAGCGVVMYTAGSNVRYDLGLWGDGDQGTTVPATTELAVRATIARRRAIAARQGIRPGALADARKALVG